LPTCSATFEGALINVNNSNSATWGATLPGVAGPNHVLVRCNGTNWTIVGI
jgi:hypothetical protein